MFGHDQPSNSFDDILSPLTVEVMLSTEKKKKQLK